MKKSSFVFIPVFVLATFCISPAFAAQNDAANVSQLVAELKARVMSASMGDEGRARVNGALNKCASQPTPKNVCSCLNENLPSRADKIVTRCNMLSSNYPN